MAAVDHSLTTEARIKTRLGITAAGFDTLIKRLMYACTDFIERECGGRRFKETTYSQELYDGSLINEEELTKEFLVLKNAPIVSISAFEYRTGTRTSPTWVAFQADTYEPLLDRGLIRAYGGIPGGYQNIRVSYVGGYKIDFTNEFDAALHTLPYELSDLCERLVIKRFKKREKEGVSQESFAETSLTWKELLDDADKAVILSHIRPHFV